MNRYTMQFRAPLPIGNDSSAIYARTLHDAVRQAEAVCDRNGWRFKCCTEYVEARSPTNLLDMRPDQFAEGSAARLLRRICASDRCPGLVNGEARLCEAFHAEALDVLSREAVKAQS